MASWLSKEFRLLTADVTSGKDIYIQRRHGSLVGEKSSTEINVQLYLRFTGLTGRPSRYFSIPSSKAFR